ncbi:MAG: putative transrane efflux pump (multidrug resistance related protein) [Acidimicrobiaceae bacterium]|nr:putative transrane efflux pump (multidrug resistance related protein) [Acidimicrobiaceae bacterium]
MPQVTVHDDRYKWVALTNTTLGVFVAVINSSIILISLPAIFRGIGINPLLPGNVGYLLWLLMGFLLVMAVLVISLGRLGDIVGRVRIFNLGFAVFTIASILLALDPFHAGSGAIWLVLWRLVQGVGGAMIFANASAILVDAFPVGQRGLAMGINQVAAIGGTFIGLILGGVLSVVDWRLIFWVSVPFGLIGTVWSYLSLRDSGVRTAATIDWWGNLTFAVGLTSVLVGIVYGIEPHGGSSMGWTSPLVLSAFTIGVVLLFAFFVIENKIASPMIDLRLFRIRAFFMGSGAGFLMAVARGGLQFMLIIWLQGIWLPLHGYNYSDTPLWAGIFLLPLTVGFLIAGPLSGYLSDRHGARILSTAGLGMFALSFLGLLFVPTNFSYWVFALLVFANGVGGGMFSAPNSAAVMNSVPPEQRGGAAGIQAALMNTGMVLSIGVFFSLMIVGLTKTLPSAMYKGLTAHGVALARASTVAHTPVVSSLFSSFLGFNPLKSLLVSPSLSRVNHVQWGTLTGKHFFPSLLQSPFHHGLIIVFSTAIAISVIGALFSAFRGERYFHQPVTANEVVSELASTSSGLPGEIALDSEVVR